MKSVNSVQHCGRTNFKWSVMGYVREKERERQNKEESNRGGKRDLGIITNRVSRTEEKSVGERKKERQSEIPTERKKERMKERMQERENVLKLNDRESEIRKGRLCDKNREGERVKEESFRRKESKRSTG